MDDKPKAKKVRIKNKGYGLYSGIVTEEGKKVDNPSETEAIKTMAKYMKNNNSDQSSSPSNVYREKFSHLSMAYDRKKGANNS